MFFRAGNDKMTIKEIAKMCNVSISTVSNVINGKNKAGDETTRKILEVIRETGYQPSYLAKGLRSQSTKMIGVIVEDLILFSVPDIVDGIMECCEQHGYKVILENMRLYARWHGEWFHNKELYKSALQPALKELNAINVDGLIYVAGHEHMITDFGEDFRLPTVMAYSLAPASEIPSYLLDDFKGGYDMAHYLLSMGHKRIGIIAGERDNVHTMSRTKGFQKAFYENGILYDPDLLEYARWEKEGGYKAAPDILKRGVSAVFCMSDSIAGGLYEYMREHGIAVGKDISVAGYDDQIMAGYMSPPLTTMALPLNEIGFRSAKRLITMLNGEEPSEKTEVKLPCTLVERESVKKLQT